MMERQNDTRAKSDISSSRTMPSTVAIAALMVLAIANAESMSCPVVELNVEYKQPSHYSEVNASDASGCCDACTADPRCISWSFKASDVPKGIPCRLLAGTPILRRNESSFVSGLSAPPPPTPAPAPALRLRVDGPRLLDPSSTPPFQPIRLVGFNWQIGRAGKAGEGAYMRSVFPGANVARVVGVLWDNQDHSARQRADDGKGAARRLSGTIGDCMTSEAPTYFNDKCFRELDETVRAATDAGVWVILTVRSKYGAGQNFDTDPMSDVFHNTTLRSRFFAMWRHIADHYRTFDRIAAYEIMAEPRDKAIDVDTVREFYEGGCAAAHTADPHTPCMVGGRPYYKLWAFGPELVLRNTTNAIYTFDYFDPDAWSFGRQSLPQYNMTYNCSTLYPGWEAICCNGNGSFPGATAADSPVRFDRHWSAANLARWAIPVREQLNVPLFVNQWGVAYGVGAASGRYDYMRDLAELLQTLDIGWAWWTWRGGGDVDWKHGSMEIVYDYANGTVGVDHKAVAALAPSMAKRPQL